MSIAKHTSAAIAVAALLNTVLYLVGRATGATYIVPMGPQGDLGLLPLVGVLIVTAGTIAVGGGAYALLSRIAPQKAWGVFLGLVGMVVLASFLPFIAEFDATTKVWLATMHLTTPGALVLLLARMRRSGAV